jgi:hypothetical protein
MKSTLRMAGFWLVLGVVCLCSAQRLRAQSAKASPLNSGINGLTAVAGALPGCGYSPGEAPAAPAPSQNVPRKSSGASRQPSLVLISSHNDRNQDEDSDRADIVGLWKFAFTAEGNGVSGPPDGAPIDAGYVTWHSDGTELMNSGRAPTTGSFCMGVWKQDGRSTYKLNHFALSWNFDLSTPVTAPGTGGADFVGPANIREEVTVDDSGNSYAGTFTLIQYAADGTTILASIKGKVTATRITAD